MSPPRPPSHRPHAGRPAPAGAREHEDQGPVHRRPARRRRPHQGRTQAHRLAALQVHRLR